MKTVLEIEEKHCICTCSVCNQKDFYGREKEALCQEATNFGEHYLCQSCLQQGENLTWKKRAIQ